MSDMKCPFCQQKLQYDDLLCSCINEHCEESFDMVGTELLWQKVIDLKQEIDSTRKALDVAVDALKLMYQGNGDPQDIMRYIDNRWTPVRRLCKQTLEQITALEQKD